MPSEHEFINNIYSYLETKKEIVFCRIEYSVFHGIIFSKINNSNLYIYNKIIKNIQGEDGESWKGFILESNLKEKEILTISKVINDTPLAIFPEPSRYEFGEISEDLATSLIEANLKQSDAIKIASCLFLLKEQYENFLHQKEYMVDLHDLVSFTNYDQGVEL